MLRRLQRKLPQSDTLSGHLSQLHAHGFLDPGLYHVIQTRANLDDSFRHFLKATIIVRGRLKVVNRLILSQEVAQFTYPAFIRLLSSMSNRESVLHTHVQGVFDPFDKPPIDDKNSTHTPIEALCETGWRKLEFVLGRHEFAKLILGNMVFMELRKDCYFQVSGPRVDHVITGGRNRPKLLKGPPGRIGQKVPRKNVLRCKQGMYYSLGKTGYNLSLRDLMDLKDQKVEIEHVLESMFPYSYDKSRSKGTIPKRLVPFVDIVSTIMNKCQKYNFLRLLDTWFPLDRDYDSSGHSLNHVVSFCFAASHLLFPHVLFGSADNWAVLRSKYVYYLNLPARTAPHLDTMTQGFKLTDIDWLFTSDKNLKKSRDDMFKAKELFDQLMIWMTNRFLPQLLRSFFYFTDSLTSDQIIYRQAVWQQRTRATLQELKRTQFSSHVLTPSDLGVSKFRLVPKKAGFRPIVSLGRPTQGSKKATSVNRKLSKLHKVLYQEFRLGGHNRYGLDSVHLLKKVLAKYQNGVKSDLQHLQFVKIDVTAAFDTIPASKVKDISRRLLNCDSYSLHRHSRIMPMSSKTILRWFSTSRACDGRSEGTLQAFRRLGNKGIVVDENKSDSIGKQLLYKLLNDHLFRNDVIIDGQVHRQVRGIPQGSVLSSLFCSMVYEEMVLTKFSDLVDRPDTCLMRYVDDFLLITTDTATATEFLTRALEGVPDYGVSVNRSKCLVNFPLTINGSKIAQLGKDEMMPFLGMKIDPTNLHIHRDYPYSSSLMWVDKGVRLAAVALRAKEYFSARFPRLLLNKSVPETVVLKNVSACFRYVFLRALRTLKHFDNVPEMRLAQEAVTLAAEMIDVSLCVVAPKCPHVELKKLRGWLTRIAVKSLERRR